MKKVLIPVDFSRSTKSLIRYAVSFAEDIPCRLVFFHSSATLIPTSSTQDAYRLAVSEDLKSKEKLMTAKLDGIAKELDVLPQSISVYFVVKRGGNVVDDIIETLDEEKIDLVIMSTHGATGWKKVLLGSVTSKIIRIASTPVLAIPVNYKYHKIESLIYASDLQDFEIELKEVMSLSRLTNAHVEVLSFNHPVPISKLEREKLGSKGVMFTVKDINEKPVIDHLKSYLRNKPAAVLVMFTQPGSHLEKLLFGSKTEEMAMDLHFPLLALHKRDVPVSKD